MLKRMSWISAGMMVANVVFGFISLRECYCADDEVDETGISEKTTVVRKKTDVEQSIERLKGFYFRAGLGMGEIDSFFALSRLSVGGGYQFNRYFSSGIYLDSLTRSATYFDFNNGLSASNIFGEILIFPIPRAFFVGGRSGFSFVVRDRDVNTQVVTGPILGFEVPLKDVENALTFGLEASYFWSVHRYSIGEESLKFGLVQGFLKYRL